MTTCRVYTLPSGRVLVTYPAPNGRLEDESERDWLARVFARAAEADPSLAGLPYVDMDDSDLPARSAICADCEEEHPIRDQWRAAANGGPAIETSARNLLADTRHLELAEIHELGLADPDPSKLAAIDIARRRMRLHFTGQGAAPSEESVAAAIDNRIQRRAR